MFSRKPPLLGDNIDNFIKSAKDSVLQTQSGGVSSLNDILGINGTKDNTSDEIIEIELSRLRHFRKHPFRLYTGARLNDMIESIKENGILVPLLVRLVQSEEGDYYEILSGHNRANAAMLAGLTKALCIVRKGLSDEAAMRIVILTNLQQRSFADLSYSEKAIVLTEYYNALKEEGKKTDLINEIQMVSDADNFNENDDSCPVGTQGRTDQKTGEAYHLSARTVSRYLKINLLIGGFKERLDAEEIPFRAAVDLSFLNTEVQELLEGLLQNNPSYKIDTKRSDMIKSLYLGRSLTEERMEEILSGKYFKSNKPKSKAVKLKPKLLKRFFKEEQPAEIERIIEEALELYFNRDN